MLYELYLAFKKYNGEKRSLVKQLLFAGESSEFLVKNLLPG